VTISESGTASGFWRGRKSDVATIHHERKKRESQWIEIIERIAIGEPVLVTGLSRNGLYKNVNDTISRMQDLGHKHCLLKFSNVPSGDGWLCRRIDWPLRQVTTEQRDRIEAFAVAPATGPKRFLFVRGLAGIDVEQAVEEIAAATGVALAIEGAVWHRGDGKTDRACWIVKGGA
jgi:hypothetical protein